MKGLVALLAVATGLGGIIALEVAHGALPDMPGEAIRTAPIPQVRVQAASSPDRAAQEASLLSRPPLYPSRRPAAAAAVPSAPVVATVASPAPRLSGLLVGPFGRSAIFTLPDTPKSIVAGEGGQVGAYTVERITAGEAVLNGPAGRLTLRPSFVGGDKRAAPPAAPADAAVLPMITGGRFPLAPNMSPPPIPVVPALVPGTAPAPRTSP